MENIKPRSEELFEEAIVYPDVDMQRRQSRLVGLDEQKEHITKVLGLLVNPEGIAMWVKKHHPSANKIVDIVLRRPPLIVLAGDVGSGKSELAYTIVTVKPFHKRARTSGTNDTINISGI